MGVGKKPHPDYDLAAWVLGRFSPEDSKLMDEAAQRAVDAIEVILSQGFDKASNQFSK
jgi:PTH1 family peptidyl-tRNA hydrolase